MHFYDNSVLSIELVLLCILLNKYTQCLINVCLKIIKLSLSGLRPIHNIGYILFQLMTASESADHS